MNAPDRAARGAALVAIAREAIADPRAYEAARWDDPWLAAPGAAFVTLRLDGALRGCIGSLEPRRALGDDVVHNARAAAYGDPRFPPVEAGERERLEVEVSVLTRPEPIPGVASESDARAALRPGVDGVVLEVGPYRSTFLPQVWEGLPDPADFLAELKRKAGLPRDYWDPAVRLSRYTVEKFR